MPNGYNELELQVLAEMGVGPNDPAADAMLEALASTKEKQLAGDPAFQPGSRFFESRHGGETERALSLFGQPGEDDLISLLMEMWSKQQGAGDRGWVPMSQQEAAEQAAAMAAYQRALQIMGLEQEFQSEMTGLGREFERGEMGRELSREQQYALETLGLGQEHERGMGQRSRRLAGRLAGMAQAGETQQRGREMAHSGQASMIDIFGRDPAQSVLFELGATGGDLGQMPPL